MRKLVISTSSIVIKLAGLHSHEKKIVTRV